MSASYMEKVVPVAGSTNPIKIQLWDTAGSERFKTINRIYYRDATAAIVVYDITKRNSLFVEAEHWIKDLKENAPPNVIIGLVGNKSDLYKYQEISLAELQSFAQRHSITIQNEASAKLNTGINEIFQKVVQKIDEKKDEIAAKNIFKNQEKIRLGESKNGGSNKKKCSC